MLLALLLILSPPLEPIGDGGARRLIVKNPNVHPMTMEIGRGAALRPLEIEGYGEATLHLQCVDRGQPLELLLKADKEATLQPPPVAFPDGPPALWITSARQGRAALAALMKPHVGGTHLRHMALNAAPDDFAALRFAPFLILSLADLLRLEPPVREAIRAATASGAVLIIATGSAEGDADALKGWSPARLGEARRPGPEVLASISHASARRRIEAPAEATRVIADGGPLVVESRLGVGRVRVVGLSLSDLGAGPVSQALFAPTDDLSPALRWLSEAPPPPAPKRLLSPVVFLALGLLPLLGLIAGRWRRVALPLAVAWGAFAFTLPATPDPLQLEALRVLEIPFGARALFMGVADLSLRQGGPRRLPSSLRDVSLEEMNAAGCLIRHSEGADWLFEGEVGARRRLTFFAVGPATGEGVPTEEALYAWPPGALSGAPLREGREAPELLPLQPKRLTHRVITTTPARAVAPLHLSAAPD